MRLADLGMAMAAAALLVSACSRNSSSDDVLPAAPASRLEPMDEFAVVPTKPIALPESISRLPVPSDARPDRAQTDPVADARVALGGNRRSGAAGTVPRDDFGLVSHASRLGTNRHIRVLLAAEDEQFRRGKKGKLLERWFNVNLYYQAYEPQTLDANAELTRLRRNGIRTPSAPPPPAK